MKEGSRRYINTLIIMTMLSGPVVSACQKGQAQEKVYPEGQAYAVGGEAIPVSPLISPEATLFPEPDGVDGDDPPEFTLGLSDQAGDLSLRDREGNDIIYYTSEKIYRGRDNIIWDNEATYDQGPVDLSRNIVNAVLACETVPASKWDKAGNVAGRLVNPNTWPQVEACLEAASIPDDVITIMRGNTGRWNGLQCVGFAQAVEQSYAVGKNSAGQYCTETAPTGYSRYENNWQFLRPGDYVVVPGSPGHIAHVVGRGQRIGMFDSTSQLVWLAEAIGVGGPATKGSLQFRPLLIKDLKSLGYCGFIRKDS